MDKQFMREYFDKMYEEPISVIVEGDSEYEKHKKEMYQKINEFEAMVGGPDAKECKVLDEILTKCDEMWECVITNAYLLGAKDRERMLK
ncbi:MAG: hypothetical protein LUG99_03140 [Lachnospiraceae bacterium]|nr:hypothetical protein [Lachnospiraceae bacterium]